jgi:hypothetical protein
MAKYRPDGGGCQGGGKIEGKNGMMEYWKVGMMEWGELWSDGMMEGRGSGGFGKFQ